MPIAELSCLHKFLKPSAEEHYFQFTDAQTTDSKPLWLSPLDAPLPDDMLPFAKKWAEAQNFRGEAGSFTLLPNEHGQTAGAIFGLGEYSKINNNDIDPFSNDSLPARSPFVFGALPALLPAGAWHFAPSSLSLLHEPFLACLGMILGSYQFRLGKEKAPVKQVKFSLPQNVDKAALTAQAEAIFLTRNLINLPANIMTCEALELAARQVAKQFSAEIKVIQGDMLIEHNFPLIHAVGRAGSEAPRLIDIIWDNRPQNRRNAGEAAVTLVGKGVCFDTGGLDIKSAAGMLLMKKDMGGAANVLGLGFMIMSARLPVRLRILIPAVENAISGNAFRPGDILPSRKGLTVEIGNTDAEGRLILADALAYADEEAPALLIDMATLTGAARVALGPDVPPFYCRSRAFAESLSRHAVSAHDPLWHMPLWQNYMQNLASPAADINNVTKDGFAGSITAALFLSRFVERAAVWAHLDIFGWRPKAAPAFPLGGDAQGIRALFAAICENFPNGE